MLSALAVRLSAATERFVPSAFAIALLLTFFTFAVATALTGASPARVVVEWGNGFWTLESSRPEPPLRGRWGSHASP